MNDEMEMRHIGREIKTALELAIVALAPAELVDGLALAAGLLDALGELPSDSAPVRALAVRTTERARAALAEWQKWEHTSLKKASA
jgi:hypothetical protein